MTSDRRKTHHMQQVPLDLGPVPPLLVRSGGRYVRFSYRFLCVQIRDTVTGQWRNVRTAQPRKDYRCLNL